MGPYYHSMVGPQAVDGVMASNMEGRCEYTEMQSWTAIKACSSSFGVKQDAKHSLP